MSEDIFALIFPGHVSFDLPIVFFLTSFTNVRS